MAQAAQGQHFRRLHFLFDRDGGPADRLLPRWLFLRALGGVYFSAFFALLFQIRGLIGTEGILPVRQLLAALRPLGQNRIFVAPSLLWLAKPPGPTDGALLWLIAVGLAASVLVVVNLVPRAALLLCWVCFLSFVTVAQDFSQYQSDGMLLEAGFLAIFLAPTGWRPGWGRHAPPVRAAWLLLLWEWFRIYFESGMVKLLSGDRSWRDLTAMYEYYQNGPLPTWVGWYLQHLPYGFHRFTAGLTLVMELLLIFLAFLPRPWRMACFVIVTVWQAGVIATANYAFLNYLVLILGVLLLDDRALLRFVPGMWQKGLVDEGALPPARERVGAARVGARRHPREVIRALRIALTSVGLTWLAYATAVPLLAMFWPAVPLPMGPVLALGPWRVANTYGLFAVMTPHRYELEFQGSADGRAWTAYPFRYKPQNPDERPRIYAPYQPRFDWNLWFASLTTWGQAPIVARTEIRLLEGSPAVLGLFAGDPFRAHPPRFVRAVLWQYWFSTAAEKRATGAWWRRQMLGTYAPTITREPDGSYVAVAVPTWNGPPE